MKTRAEGEPNEEEAALQAERRGHENNEGKGCGRLTWLIGSIILIGLIGSIAIPPSGGITPRARAMKGVSNAKQIVLALKVFAIEHDGRYPEVGETYTVYLSDGSTKDVTVRASADSIFNALLPEYMPTESVFFHAQSGQPRPNENGHIDSGENHWSYVDGLSDSSMGSLPLVFLAPGIVEPELQWFPYKKYRFSPGKSQPGVTFGESRGKMKTVVALNDGSAMAVPLKRDGTLKEDFLEGLPEELRVLHPEWLVPLTE